MSDASTSPTLSYELPSDAEMLLQQVSAHPDLWLERLSELSLRLTNSLQEAQQRQDQIIEHLATIKKYQSQTASLNLEIAELKIAVLTAARPAKSEKTPDVDRFDGSREKLPTFIAECRVKFTDNADRYPSEDLRMNYIFTRCTGPAKEQLLPFWEEEATAALAPFHDTDSLLTWLHTCFGDPNPKGTAQYKISYLRMANREFSQYLADFNKHIERTGWNAEAKKSSLLSGLSTELRNLLIHHDTENMNLRELTTLCQRLDTKLRASHASTSRPTRFGTQNESNTARAPLLSTNLPATAIVSTPRPFRPFLTGANATPVAERTTTQGGTRMDLSNTRKPLTDAEKQHRRDNRLCLYCGEPGHVAITCPKKALRVYEIENDSEPGKE